MSQTTYNREAPVAFAGLLGDFGASVRSSISLANENASAIPYGAGVVFGTDPDKQFDLPAGTGFNFAGVVVHKHAHEDLTANGPVNGETAEVLRRGPIWVKVEEAVTPASDVFLRHTANGPLLPGGWRTDADTANADQITSAKFLTSAAADGFALLEINVP